MIKRPLNERFSAAVLEGRKFTTIRETPWPIGVPIMLYHWSGVPYRSKQLDVATIEVEEVMKITVTHHRDGWIDFSRDNIYGIPIYQTEGFDDAGQMLEWFGGSVPKGKTVELSLMRFGLANAEPIRGDNNP